MITSMFFLYFCIENQFVLCTKIFLTCLKQAIYTQCSYTFPLP